jgi:hypothetical protein
MFGRPLNGSGPSAGDGVGTRRNGNVEGAERTRNARSCGAGWGAEHYREAAKAGHAMAVSDSVGPD